VLARFQRQVNVESIAVGRANAEFRHTVGGTRNGAWQHETAQNEHEDRGAKAAGEQVPPRLNGTGHL
jgi:hypothetical protein